MVASEKNRIAQNILSAYSQEDIQKSVELSKAEGSRGGHVIGHTKSGHPVYASHGPEHYTEPHHDSNFHREAHEAHRAYANKHSYGTKEYHSHHITSLQHAGKYESSDSDGPDHAEKVKKYKQGIPGAVAAHKEALAKLG